MRRDVKCKLCGHFLGSLHGNQIAMVFTDHFKRDHPKEFKELAKLRDMFMKKRELYYYRGYDEHLRTQ